MLKVVLKNLLYGVAGILNMPSVDFEKDITKYERVFQKLDSFRRDHKFTDEELGELLEEIGKPQGNVILQKVFYGIAGLCKSRLVDFTWDVSNYEKVFDRLNHMREDNVFTDEELAEFCGALADSL